MTAALTLPFATVDPSSHDLAPELRSGDGGLVGLSQAVPQAAAEARSASVSGFVNRLKSEADPEQPVLLADGPRAGKAEALA